MEQSNDWVWMKAFSDCVSSRLLKLSFVENSRKSTGLHNREKTEGGFTPLSESDSNVTSGDGQTVMVSGSTMTCISV